MEEGNLKKLLSMIKSIERKSSEFESYLYYALGENYYELRNYKTSLKYLRKAKELDPSKDYIIEFIEDINKIIAGESSFYSKQYNIFRHHLA